MTSFSAHTGIPNVKWTGLLGGMQDTATKQLAEAKLLQPKPSITSCLALWLLLLRLLAPALLQAQAATMAVHVIDVGQGDATLLEFPCGALLLDAGAQDETHADKLIHYLQRFFRRRNDLSSTFQAVFITHPHKDHTFALKRVLQTFTTKRFLENGENTGSGLSDVKWVRSYAASNGITTRTILNSQIFTNGNQLGITDADIDPLSCKKCDPELRILSGQWDTATGWPKTTYGNNNNHSLVIRVDFGQSSFLFTGDLEKDAIDGLLGQYGRDAGILDVDVYHVGHHGSHNATTQALLDAMTPIIAVMSVGHWDSGKETQNPYTTWAYGHPRRVTVDLLSRNIHGTRSEPVQVNLATGQKTYFPVIVSRNVYATAWDGNIVIKANLFNQFKVIRNN